MGFYGTSLLLNARWRRLGLLTAVPLPLFLIWALWYAVNSDRDDIPPILTHLIPAGHATCQSATTFQCSSCLEQHPVLAESDDSSWTFQYGRDDRDRSLSETQCSSAFPGLFEDIHLGVSYWREKGSITQTHLDDVAIGNSMTRATIYNGYLFIIETKSRGEDHRRKMIAVLSSMHRALSAMTPPDRKKLLNTEFIFSIEDKASDIVSTHGQPLWVLARKVSERSYFLIPDFGYWVPDSSLGNKNNKMGPYDEVVDDALELESKINGKIPELVWRGKLSFAPKLRRSLLDAARGKKWSNVKEVNWKRRDNYLPLEELCRYTFIAHVEGRSYSGSLKYRQACRSVIFIHKLQYIQHHHYLLVADGIKQNYVEVERDFTDLDWKMEALLANPEQAQRIANNSVETFRERYLTQAAEACYWRALWRGYSRVFKSTEYLENNSTKLIKRGLRFETFAMLSSEEMLNFKTESD